MAAKEQEKEIVEAREFNLTKRAKTYGTAIGILFPAVVGAISKIDGVKITTPIVLGALGVTAVVFLAISFIAAVDIAARAYLSGEGSAEDRRKEGEGEKEETPEAEAKPSASAVIAAPAGTQVWLDGSSDPHPVLAMSGDGEKVSSYLVATGSTVERSSQGGATKALDGGAKWYTADQIRATRPAGWP